MSAWTNYHHYPAINPKSIHRDSTVHSDSVNDPGPHHESRLEAPHSRTNDDEPEYILVTYFPTPYEEDPRLTALALPPTSSTSSKRDVIERIVVRIPRSYETYGDAFPQFVTEFTPENFPRELTTIFQRGGSSATSAGPRELSDLIIHINAELQRALDALRPLNILQLALGVLTCWISDTLLASMGWDYSKWKLNKLDRWIQEKNDEWRAEGKCARVIPLRWSGYLSLDIEVTRLKND